MVVVVVWGSVCPGWFRVLRGFWVSWQLTTTRKIPLAGSFPSRNGMECGHRASGARAAHAMEALFLTWEIVSGL
jgi:hypothetical protein